MADTPEDRAKKIIDEEMTKGMIGLAVELARKHGVGKALVISHSVEPLSKIIAKEMKKIPPPILMEATEYLRDIFDLGIAAGRGYLAMIEEVKKSPCQKPGG
jgi:hypothetical protein